MTTLIDSMPKPVTQYAKSGDIHIAYQTFGSGPDLIMSPPFVSQIENFWDEPRYARWMAKLGSFARVTVFDKRGTGLSDRVSDLPGLDERVNDILAVMDAAHIERATLFGVSEGGSLAAFFAAIHPERVNSLILYGAFARFCHWVPTDEAFDGFIQYIDEHWGSGASLPMFAPSKAEDHALQEWWGKFERLGASPSAAMALMRMNREIDISEILPSIHVPTLVIHLTNDTLVNVEGGRELARGIPNAKLIELPGTDHIPFLDAGDQILQEMQEFMLGTRTTSMLDRVLATVLFEDIVNSTITAKSMDDLAWSDLMNAHNKIVRQELARYKGKEVKTLGDGFLATFDTPARAIQCSYAIRDSLKSLGLNVRVGIHTGEVEMTSDEDVRGIAINLASRIANEGHADEIVVSRTVKDLVAGSGITFKDFGRHALKGISKGRQLYLVSGLRI